MRWIVVPPPITPTTLDGDPFVENNKPVGELTMDMFLMRYILGEMNPPTSQGGQATLKIGQGHEGVVRMVKINRKFSQAKAYDVVDVDSDDWTLVSKIINEKSWAGAHIFAMALAPFSEAWLDAKEDKAKALATIPEGAVTSPNGEVEHEHGYIAEV